VGTQLTQFGRGIVVPAGVPNTTAISLNFGTGQQVAAGGVATVSGNITLGRELRLDGLRSNGGFVGGAITLTGTIADGGGTGSIDVHGGNWNFWGTNTYSGRTYFEAGTSNIVGVGTDSVFGTGPVIIANQANTVTFRADNGPRTVGNTFTFEGGASGTTANAVGFIGVNDLTFTSPTVDLAAATRTLNVNSTGTTTFTGNIVNGDPTSAIVKTGAGTLVLSGASTFVGAFTLNGGVLGLGSDSAGAITSGPIGTGTLNLNAGTLRAVNGARTVNNPVTVGGGFAIDGANDLTLGGPINLGTTVQQVVVTNTGKTTFAGVVSGTGGGLAKAGAGTLILTGANTYTGGTTVTGGALLVNNASGSSGTGTGPVTVTGTGTAGSGGTLGGTGFISGNVTISSTAAATQGGTVSPGNSPGTLTVTGSSVLTWNPLGTYVFEHDATATGTAPVGGNNDLIKGTGTSSLSLANLGTGTGQQFNLFLKPIGLAPPPNQPVTYTLFDFTASTNPTPIVPPAGFSGTNLTPYFNITGSFQSTPAPILTLVNGNQIRATFTPVPEPEFILTAVAGLVALVGGWRHPRWWASLKWPRIDHVLSGALPH
jgi:autotransporter-associated beta strand protein